MFLCMQITRRASVRLRWLMVVAVACGVIAVSSSTAQAAFGDVTTFAGSGVAGNVDATGTAATFNKPQGLAFDTAGNMYVAESGNYTIRKITPAGAVTTLAGSGSPGNSNGTGSAASFNIPTGTAVDAAGNVFVSDFQNNLIRKISPAGVVTTFAGSGSFGSANGSGTSASFAGPQGVAIDAAGNVFVADRFNNRIRKITPAGLVSNVAGSGISGNTDGNGVAASFNDPLGIAVDPAGNLYVADFANNTIRKISPIGDVTTLAGSGSPGATDGTGTGSSFNFPTGVATDSSGNVFVADGNNNLIRKITAAGVVTTLAGSGSAGNVDAPGTAASFNFPSHVTADATGNVFVSDTNNNLIRKIDATSAAAAPTTTTTTTVVASSTTASPTTTTASSATITIALYVPTTPVPTVATTTNLPLVPTIATIATTSVAQSPVLPSVTTTLAAVTSPLLVATVPSPAMTANVAFTGARTTGMALMGAIIIFIGVLMMIMRSRLDTRRRRHARA